MWRWALDHLVCPACRGGLVLTDASDDARQGVLAHQNGSCRERYPVIDGIPRLLLGHGRGRLVEARADWFTSHPFAEAFADWRQTAGQPRNTTDSVVARFDSEWHAFARVGTSEHVKLFEKYFDIVPGDRLVRGSIALDAGCGSGRWAQILQSRGPRVIAVDLGLSIEVAERNTRGGRVACVQADVRELPVRDGSIDFAYSLGVLHHVEGTAEALKRIATSLRPDGLLLVYMYYKLDARAAWYRTLFALAELIRRASAPLPQPLLVALTTAIAGLVYLPLARTARLLRRVGQPDLADALPLSFYADLSFETMRNDSLDRFGSRLEKRYSKPEVVALLEAAGLSDVHMSDSHPYWHAIGRRARSD